jgi:RNA polymerase sigma factor (sigma-70 family)
MTGTEPSTAQLQALLDRACLESQQAQQPEYEPLIAIASERLLRLTRRMLRNYPHLRRWEQTEDIFQTAVMKLYRSLSEVRPASVREFFGLAVLQIRRTLIDLARHHFGPEGEAAHHHSDHRPAAAGDDPNRLRDPVSRSCRPETLAEWSEFHELVDRLPPDERDIFHLVWYAGLPQKDIAELMHISLPTVQRRWYAAQLNLYELLQGESPLSREDTDP